MLSVHTCCLSVSNVVQSMRDLLAAKLLLQGTGSCPCGVRMCVCARICVCACRCPHRLAPLSEGKVVEDTLQCSYHGWRFQGDGSCVSLPQVCGLWVLRYRQGRSQGSICVCARVRALAHARSQAGAGGCGKGLAPNTPTACKACSALPMDGALQVRWFVCAGMPRCQGWQRRFLFGRRGSMARRWPTTSKPPLPSPPLVPTGARQPARHLAGLPTLLRDILPRECQARPDLGVARRLPRSLRGRQPARAGACLIWVFPDAPQDCIGGSGCQPA